MIGIDTNILVRFITRDDAIQTAFVLGLFEKHKGKSKSIYINVIALCELVWVLNCGYHYPKSQIIAALDLLFLVDEFKLENPASVQEAFVLYKTGMADFSDYVLFCINKNQGCSVTYSFDKKAVNESIFESCDTASTICS
jgi:predicted nucleic-acid-binding protein